jgi:hypothetical protein
MNRWARLPLNAWDERRQLHEEAWKIAVRNRTKESDDLRTLISYWRGSVHAADRAAAELTAYACMNSSSRSE